MTNPNETPNYSTPEELEVKRVAIRRELSRFLVDKTPPMTKPTPETTPPPTTETTTTTTEMPTTTTAPETTPPPTMPPHVQ